jgi:Lsr2
MANDDSDIRAWARSNGYDVADRGRLSRDVRDAYQQAHIRLLPGPDDDHDDDEYDLGEVDIGEYEPEPEPELAPEPEPAPAGDALDPPPAPVGKRNRARPRTTKAPTAAVGRDIHGKVGMIVTVSGHVWAARDPYCGGMFVQQTPDITSALTDLVLESPDLVAFFTGPAGGFMKWFKLAAALQPVALVAWSHHVAHTIGDEDAGDRPRVREYAA